MISNALRGLAVAGAILATTAAGAATLTPDGIVMVNRGNGFIQVTEPTTVGPGDRIMVSNGQAMISCGQQGSSTLSAGQLYTLSGSGCDGLVGQQAGGPEGLPGGGGGVPGAPGGVGGIAGGSLSTVGMIAGGAAVAVGVAVAVGAGSSKSSSP